MGREGFIEPTGISSSTRRLSLSSLPLLSVCRLGQKSTYYSSLFSKSMWSVLQMYNRLIVVLVIAAGWLLLLLLPLLLRLLLDGRRRDVTLISPIELPTGCRPSKVDVMSLSCYCGRLLPLTLSPFSVDCMLRVTSFNRLYPLCQRVVPTVRWKKHWHQKRIERRSRRKDDLPTEQVQNVWPFCNHSVACNIDRLAQVRRLDYTVFQLTLWKKWDGPQLESDEVTLLSWNRLNKMD